MKHIYRDSATIVTVRITLLLAVIFISGCNVAGTAIRNNPVVVEATSIPSATTVPDVELRSATPSPPDPNYLATKPPTPLPLATTTSVPDEVSSAEQPTVLAQLTPAVIETSVTISTYPIKEFLVEQLDPLYNIPVYYFNRPAFEAANPSPSPVEYSAVVLENPYLRLTFLPQLGGRLYSAVIKATNQEIFYHNKVIKPSRFGVLQPPEANWWLAAGGMEFAHPTQEHGYRFGTPWSYEIAESVTGNSITLSDSAPNRLGVNVTVTLPHDSAAFTVAPAIANNGTTTVPIQLWTNAALTLGADTMSILTQFVVPTEVITVHSRGPVGWDMPDAGQPAPWPYVGQTDLRDYGQWSDYLGFFVANSTVPFVGAYNPDSNLGVVRLVKTSTPHGSGKVFAFGSKYPYTDYTDDGSQYFELWGGANAGFWPEDDIQLTVGQSIGWEEVWWPLAQLNGLTWASQDIAIAIGPTTDNGFILSALSAQPLEGRVQVLANGAPLLDEPFSGEPATPLQWNVPNSNQVTEIIFFDNNGRQLLTYQLQ